MQWWVLEGAEQKPFSKEEAGDALMKAGKDMTEEERRTKSSKHAGRREA
jgi:hypothetical protein